MKIPKTYEEFCQLSDAELTIISKSDMSLVDAQRMMKFFDKFDEEYKKKHNHIFESKNENIIVKFEDYLK